MDSFLIHLFILTTTALDPVAALQTISAFVPRSSELDDLFAPIKSAV